LKSWPNVVILFSLFKKCTKLNLTVAFVAVQEGGECLASFPTVHFQRWLVEESEEVHLFLDFLATFCQDSSCSELYAWFAGQVEDLAKANSVIWFIHFLAYPTSLLLIQIKNCSRCCRSRWRAVESSWSNACHCM
jgi:hypothetical protein